MILSRLQNGNTFQIYSSKNAKVKSWWRKLREENTVWTNKDYESKDIWIFFTAGQKKSHPEAQSENPPELIYTFHLSILAYICG